MILGAVVVVSVFNQPHSHGYTKVYFENDVFPVLSPNKTYEIAFIIESHEKRQMKYIYTIYLDNSSVKSGEIVLNPSDVKRISVNVSLEKIPYSKQILKESYTNMTVENPAALVKVPWAYGVDLSKQRNWSGEELLYVIKNFPLFYIGEEGVSVIVNTTSGTNVTDISIERSGNGFIKTIREFNVTPVQNGYVVSIRTVKIKYYPRPVELKVIVISDSGKRYTLKTMLSVEGGDS